jgi:alkylhydroperoxidase family enzyme
MLSNYRCSRKESNMPRVPELNAANASPAVASMMAEQQAYFGVVLNPLKVIGHCPPIAEGATALMNAIEASGAIDGALRSLLYARVASLNGCPF